MKLKDKTIRLIADINHAVPDGSYPPFSFKPLKQEFFYPAKRAILRLYGQFLEYHLQVLKHECHRCHGTGIFDSPYKPEEECWCCEGTGLYKVEKYALEFYKLAGKYEIRYMHVPVPMKEGNARLARAIEESGAYGKYFTDTIPQNKEMSYRDFERLIMQFLWKFEKPTWLWIWKRYYLKLFHRKYDQLTDYLYTKTPFWWKSLVLGYKLYDAGTDWQYIVTRPSRCNRLRGKRLNSLQALEIAKEEVIFEDLPF